MALSLAATAAYKRNDFPEATRQWDRLLKQLPADSDDAKWVVQTLAEIRAQGPWHRTRQHIADDGEAATEHKAISGQVQPRARAASPRSRDRHRVRLRPFHRRRARAACGAAPPACRDLPLRFRLDDTMAMSPQHKLSDAKQVRIEARVSRQGDATPTAGDLIGASEPVTPGTQRVALTIDRVRP